VLLCSLLIDFGAISNVIVPFNFPAKNAPAAAAASAEDVSESEDGDYDDNEIEEEEVEGLTNDQETDPILPSVTEKFKSVSLSEKKQAAKMSATSTSGPFKMDFVYPYMLYDYVDDDRRHCTIDFLVPTMAEKAFRPTVNAAEQSLDLATVIPPFFANKARLMAAFSGETGFGENTHRATAMGEVCDDIEKQCEDAKADNTIIIGVPQRVKLPFPCEEEIVHWECQLFENEDEEHTDDIGVATYFNVLSVDLVGVAKKKKKKRGGLASSDRLCKHQKQQQRRATRRGKCKKTSTDYQSRLSLCGIQISTMASGK